MAHEPDLAGMRKLTLADDLLRGAPAIARYLGPAFNSRMVYHLAESGAIPVFRLPNNTTLYARKSALESAFSAQGTSAGTAETALQAQGQGPAGPVDMGNPISDAPRGGQSHD